MLMLIYTSTTVCEFECWLGTGVQLNQRRTNGCDIGFSGWIHSTKCMGLIIIIIIIIWKLVKRKNPSKIAAHCATNRSTKEQEMLYNTIKYPTIYIRKYTMSFAKAVINKCVFSAVLKADV